MKNIKNDFKKVTKFKKSNKNFIRHQFVAFNDTTKVLDKKFEIKDFGKLAMKMKKPT